jgi:hypothetical protein
MAWPKRFHPPVVVAWAGSVALGLLGGCVPWESGPETCAQHGPSAIFHGGSADGDRVGGGSHHPPPLVPEPNGAFVHKMEEIQANKAEESDFVFFLDEWYQGGTQLGPHGLYHLGAIVPRLPNVPFPVVVQPTPDAALNENRRQVIVAALAKHGVPEADQRVIVAFPTAEGLYGEEAPRIYLQMIYPRAFGGQGAYGGSGPFGFGGGFGGFGGYGYGGLGFYGGPFARPGFIPGFNPFGY